MKNNGEILLSEDNITIYSNGIVCDKNTDSIYTILGLDGELFEKGLRKIIDYNNKVDKELASPHRMNPCLLLKFESSLKILKKVKA